MAVATGTSTAPQELLARLQVVRHHSVALIAPLDPEDLCLQGMADASPPKWHLGHTTWFFETFLLEAACFKAHFRGALAAFEAADPRWGFLFNSYYDSVGARHPRPERGLLTRPPIDGVLAWRKRVDASLEAVLDAALAEPSTPEAIRWLQLLELGLQHEQQHQELLLTDLLDGFSRNPLEPAYGGAYESQYESSYQQDWSPEPGPWLNHPGGLVSIGIDSEAFHFDNETPRHRQWLEPFALASRLVTNGEYASFIADGGYERPELWMSEGWARAQQQQWQAPRYWRGEWEFSLGGRQARQAQAPVRHLSWFEADAYARWAGARLPTEAEWEVAASQAQSPLAQAELPQANGLLWQWTASPYRPYPGFAPAAGAVGEYNGKFMSSQMVLRGSSFLTPPGHARPSYRNYYPPACRWMASGLRLAKDT
ncbi:ergothioneine biosynthesis protein EgtB [Cyanobium sp. HWJ4-Hawea]|uniref:ergothioneine biosynthesis protein EgtB n=1 Tax=Cyanobium sp. HWJ4-Hawea TaxID=2823713 RepID=UPI0020CEEDAC|nr:ergothioneine biosynthesis protein EgtB [Cyanobium sp. HWJ4-Hawea]MCP9808602.1 ergothioneine biosynthesis protein EgtB [Cyanobium sp. HWJ4-Hawea]